MKHWVLGAAVLLWAAALVGAQDAPTPSTQSGDDVPQLSEEVLAVLLPQGEGRETVKRVCATECHTAERVSASAGSREYWDGIVQDMTLQGALFTGEEQEEIVGYLATQFPPRVNVNILTAALFESRLKFSPDEAAAIVAYRTTNGPFASIAELLMVPGVPPEKINAVSRQLAFGAR